MWTHHIITLFKQLQRRLIVPNPHIQSPQLETHIIAPLTMRDMIANQSQINPHISPISRGARLRQQPVPVLPEDIRVSATQPQQIEDGLCRERGFSGQRGDQIEVRAHCEALQRVPSPLHRPT